MNKCVFASLALAITLVSAPIAFADSFGSKASDSSFAVNTVSSAHHTGTGAAFSAFSTVGGEAVSAGQDARSTAASDVDNPSYPAIKGTGVRGKSGAYVEVSGDHVDLISGGIEGNGSNPQGKGHFQLVGDGSRHKDVARGDSELFRNSVALSETPEPGSLFLLGTGLLCMALVLFWKSAKRTPGSVNAE